MKINWNKKYTTIAVYCCIVIFITMLLASMLLNIGNAKDKIFNFLKIFNPIIYGFVIAFLVNPIMRFFENKVFKCWRDREKLYKFRRVLSLVIAFIIVFALIMLFVWVVVPQIVASYKELETKMGDYMRNIEAWYDQAFGENSKLPDWMLKIVNSEEMSNSLSNSLTNAYNWAVGLAPDLFVFVGNLFNELKNVLIGLIFSVYFLLSKERLLAVWKKVLYAVFSKKRVSKILRVGTVTKQNFEGFVVGKILDSMIIGVLTFFVLMIVKMPYYPLVAVIVGVTNIIPFFGPFIGAIPCAFIIFIADPIMALWFCLIIFIIQQLDGNVIGPAILGENTSLTSLGVMIAIILMTGILGVTGMFIGVPIFAVIYAFFFEWVDKRLIAKGRRRDLEAYIGNGHGTIDVEKDDSEAAKEEEPEA